MQVAIVLYPGMTALDAIGPYEILRTLPGCDLRLVWREPGPIVTDSNVLVLGATHSFDETPSPDIVLVPGSSADTATAMADTALIGWLRRVHPTTRYTLSVCSGALVLAAAGLLEGLPATTHWMAQDWLPKFGAKPQREQRIVRAGRKIITAAGVSAGLDLALFVYGELCGRDAAETAQLIIEYDPQPPFDSGHPTKARPEIFARAKKEMGAAARNPRDLVSIPTVLWRRAIDRVRRLAA